MTQKEEIKLHTGAGEYSKNFFFKTFIHAVNACIQKRQTPEIVSHTLKITILSSKIPYYQTLKYSLKKWKLLYWILYFKIFAPF